MKRLFLLLTLVTLPCSAQGRTFSVDARVVGAELALGWQTSPGKYIGLGLGGGTDELGMTLRPKDNRIYHDLEQLLYLDLFFRYKPGPRVDVDVGLRGGIGEVRECSSSDCLPGGFAGAFVGIFGGSARWKVGTRLVVAKVVESSDRDNVVHWEVLNLRYSR